LKECQDLSQKSSPDSEPGLSKMLATQWVAVRGQTSALISTTMLTSDGRCETAGGKPAPTSRTSAWHVALPPTSKSRFGIWNSGFGIQVSGFEIQTSEFSILVSGFEIRFLRSGFMDWGFILHRCREKRHQLERVSRLSPESEGHNLASTVLFVPNLLERSEAQQRQTCLSASGWVPDFGVRGLGFEVRGWEFGLIVRGFPQG